MEQRGLFSILGLRYQIFSINRATQRKKKMYIYKKIYGAISLIEKTVISLFSALANFSF